MHAACRVSTVSRHRHAGRGWSPTGPLSGRRVQLRDSVGGENQRLERLCPSTRCWFGSRQFAGPSCAAAGFAVTGAAINGRGRLSAARAARMGQNLRERPVAAVIGDHAHGKHRHAFAAVQFEMAVSPVGQPMGGEERWLMQGQHILGRITDGSRTNGCRARRSPRPSRRRPSSSRRSPCRATRRRSVGSANTG